MRWVDSALFSASSSVYSTEMYSTSTRYWYSTTYSTVGVSIDTVLEYFTRVARLQLLLVLYLVAS
jgi:hypothetical protein